LLDWIASLFSGGRVELDPSVFADPLATEVDWSPLRSGGANFATHRLVEVDSFRLDFRPATGEMALRALGTMLLMLVPMGVAMTVFTDGRAFEGFEVWIGAGVALLSLAMIGGSALLVRVTVAPVSFDKRHGTFSKEAPVLGFGRDAAGDLPLEEIHALQLVSEAIRGGGSRRRSRPYRSYELNLVTRSGGRVNVVDHSKVARLRREAARLSAFLETPVWDGPKELLAQQARARASTE
jgi:hypothetical protein